MSKLTSGLLHVGKTISQPEKVHWVLVNIQNNVVYVLKCMHTPLKWSGKRVGLSLGLGFVWSTKRCVHFKTMRF